MKETQDKISKILGIVSLLLFLDNFYTCYFLITMRWFGGLFFGVLVLFVFGYTAYKTLYKKKSLSKLEKIVVFVLIFFSLIPSLIGLLEGLTSP